MSDLKDIEKRHGKDPLRDALFIIGALLLTAISIGSVTSKVAGHPQQKQWKLTVVDNPADLVQP
jgi:hypothetical protein